VRCGGGGGGGGEERGSKERGEGNKKMNGMEGEQRGDSVCFTSCIKTHTGRTTSDTHIKIHVQQEIWKYKLDYM